MAPFLLATQRADSAPANDDRQEIANQISAYVRAVYARDFRNAYTYISSQDRRLKDVHSYSRDRGTYSGFILEAARAIAQGIEISTVKQQIDKERATAAVRVKAPAPAKLTSLMLEWDADKLEALSDAERKNLLATIDRQRRDQKWATVESEEAFALVKESTGWKILLNWAAGVKLTFQPSMNPAVPVQLQVQHTEVQTHSGQVFRVGLKIKNTGAQPLLTRIGHLVEPEELRDYLYLVECGFVQAVRLQPGKEGEFVTTYLLRGTLPDDVRRLSVTYAVGASAEIK